MTPQKQQPKGVNPSIIGSFKRDAIGGLGEGASKSKISSYQALGPYTIDRTTTDEAIEIMTLAAMDRVANTSSSVEYYSERSIQREEPKSASHEAFLHQTPKVDSTGDKAPATKKKGFLDIPPELRLNFYESAFQTLKINGNDHSLDKAVTRPALLQVNKLVRSEAMQAYLNGVFTAIIKLRAEHKEMKLKSSEMTAAVQTERDEQLQGSLMFAAAQMSVKEGHWSIRISRYTAWLKAKIVSLEKGGEVFKPRKEVFAKFKGIAEDAKGGPELMKVLEELEK